MAKQEVRTVNGKQYLYYTHYEKGGRTVTYCGPADSVDSQIMGAKLEMEQITTSIKALQARQSELKSSIASLRSARTKSGSTIKRRKSAGGAGTTKAAGRTRKKD